MLALVVLTLLGALVIAALELSTLVEDSVFKRRRATQSFYLAQAGLEAAVGEVFSGNPDWTTVSNQPLPETAFGGGFMRVEATLLETDRAVVTAIGRVDTDSLGISVTLERDAAGDVEVTAWQDPRAWNWPS
jgi:hypothetical protein